MKAIRDASPQARRHFTRFDQVNLLAKASEATADTGFMARLMMLCSLPRTNPGRQLQYKRVNGPYTLIVTAVGQSGLPFGNLSRLLLAWVCTEAVRTQSRELFLGASLSGFMRKLGIAPVGCARTRLSNQMKRLFNAHIQLAYEDKQVSASVNSPVASRTEFWWNERRPNEQGLWDSQIELGEKFFHEIIQHPVPLDLNILKALKRSSLGLDLYLWLTYRTFTLRAPATALLGASLPPVRSGASQGKRQPNRPGFSQGVPARVDQDQDRLAGSGLRDGPGGAGSLALQTRHPSHVPVACGLTLRLPFPAQGSPMTAL